MGGIAAIGEAVRVQGLGLAGVRVLPGDTPDEVRTSWASLPEDVELVILTPRASEVVRAGSSPGAQSPRPAKPGPLTVVMPP